MSQAYLGFNKCLTTQFCLRVDGDIDYTYYHDGKVLLEPNVSLSMTEPNIIIDAYSKNYRWTKLL